MEHTGSLQTYESYMGPATLGAKVTGKLRGWHKLQARRLAIKHK